MGDRAADVVMADYLRVCVFSCVDLAVYRIRNSSSGRDAGIWLPKNPASAGPDRTGETRLAVVAGYSSSGDQVRLPFYLVLLLSLSLSLSRYFVCSVSKVALFIFIMHRYLVHWFH